MLKKEKIDGTKGYPKQAKDIDNVVNEIKERFGEGAIMTMREIHAVDVDVVSTGSIAMDLALGVGGMPRGRIIEIYGAESSGKTTLSLHVIAEAQKKEAHALSLMPNTPWTPIMQGESALMWMTCLFHSRILASRVCRLLRRW